MNKALNTTYTVYLEKTSVVFLKTNEFQNIKTQFCFSTSNPILIDLGIKTPTNKIAAFLTMLQEDNIPYLVLSPTNTIEIFMHKAACDTFVNTPIDISCKPLRKMFSDQHWNELQLILKWWEIDEFNPLILLATIAKANTQLRHVLTKKELKTITDYMYHKNIPFVLYLNNVNYKSD